MFQSTLVKSFQFNVNRGDMVEHQNYLSPELASPLAAIDVGTNSIRLIIAEGLRGGKYRILDDEKQATRLGASLSRTQRLDPEAVELSMEALKRMKQIAAGFHVQQIKVIATCAVREAKDGMDFCRRVQEELGLDIEVVTSKQEARLAFFSVERNFDLSDCDVVVTDIGGGSTEIVAASNGVIEEIYGTPLGAVRLTDLFDLNNSPPAAFEKMIEFVDQTLKKAIKKPPFVPQLLIGTGGTFTTLASMMMAARGESELPMRGYQISRAEVRHLVDRLRKMTLKARRSVPGLSPDRIDIIVAGLTVIDRLLSYFRTNRLQVHTGGVRDGLLLTMVEKSGAAVVDRETAVIRLASACGVNIPHSRKVAQLAGRLFDQLMPLGAWPATDRLLLETAAMLQDVGYLINYEDHHKHSFHLILNSDLPGFRPQELQMVANLARYHRGAEPKRKHRNFTQLSPDEQRRVRQLASLLRVAGGLDRSHTQQVENVTVELEATCVKLWVHAASEPDLDLWGARRRSEMFEDVFKLPLHIEFSPRPTLTEKA